MAVASGSEFDLPPERLQLVARQNRMDQKTFLAHFRSQVGVASWLINDDLEKSRQARTQTGQAALGRCVLLQYPNLSSGISDKTALAIQYEVMATLRGVFQPEHDVEVLTLPPTEGSTSTPDLSSVEAWGLSIKDRVPSASQPV
jgi:hypothetical protein